MPFSIQKERTKVTCVATKVNYRGNSYAFMSQKQPMWILSEQYQK